MSDNPEWFAPKRYGYGAGVPISWQGWAVTIAFVGLVFTAGLLLRHNQLGFISSIVSLTLVFIVIAAKTTRGGWRWRWGDRN